MTGLRVAVVGAGRMGRLHLDACRRVPGMTAVAVVDPAARAREEAGRGEVSVYAAPDELLSAGGVDAVVIAAPSDLHRELVSVVARAGLPMLCEKPCGVTSADARAGASAAREAGVVLQIGYWRRFVPGLVELRARIAAGELGDISLVSCHQWDRNPPSQQFRAHSGGIIVDMGVHEFDQMRWLTGQEIERIVALPSGLATDLPEDPDGAAVAIRLSAGTLGFASLGRRFPRPDSCWLEVIGTAGHVHDRFMWAEQGDRVFRDALDAQLAAFAAAVAGEGQRGAGGDDAVAALAAAEHATAALVDPTGGEAG
jgi:myo-inositol 2-dehydrogenase / D-chiro-inositol 1-dehydrogenase